MPMVSSAPPGPGLTVMRKTIPRAMASLVWIEAPQEWVTQPLAKIRGQPSALSGQRRPDSRHPPAADRHSKKEDQKYGRKGDAKPRPSNSYRRGHIKTG